MDVVEGNRNGNGNGKEEIVERKSICRFYSRCFVGYECRLGVIDRSGCSEGPFRPVIRASHHFH